MTTDQTATPAQEGHAGLPPAADRAAATIVERLAHTIGHRAAVAWVHAGAILAWTGSHHLLGDIGPAGTTAGIRDGLKRLADTHPALAALTDPGTVALWDTPITITDAADIATLWAQHPLDDPPWRPHGYLLGNAYQALSEESRKHRALAQTPRYVTSLLHALALDPALDEHGTLRGFRMADPSCGTGHILVETLLHLNAWTPRGRGSICRATPARIDHALRAVHGVDLDPYAALIARLRLVTMATCLYRAIGLPLPADAPIQVATANALLTRTEPLLARGQYHAIIANPPYITPKTATERDAIRAAYPQVCHMQYALSLPFHALATDLLLPGGWCAQLTANSFMKREFGAPFIETYLPRYDLRWAIDTSGAYIPGHGTPTVILVHRNQPPASTTVTAIRGIQGEPAAPADPSRGLVWRAIEEAAYQRLDYQRRAAPHQPPPEQPATQAPTTGHPTYEQPSLLDLLGEAA